MFLRFNKESLYRTLAIWYSAGIALRLYELAFGWTPPLAVLLYETKLYALGLLVLLLILDHAWPGTDMRRLWERNREFIYDFLIPVGVVALGIAILEPVPSTPTEIGVPIDTLAFVALFYMLLLRIAAFVVACIGLLLGRFLRRENLWG